MLRVRHAILHAFDFESGEYSLSNYELNLDNKQIKSYVQRSMRKLLGGVEARTTQLVEGTNFATAMSAYMSGNVDFINLSKQLAQFMWEELRRLDDLEECDLLVAVFTDTAEMKVNQAQEATPEGEDPFAAAAEPEDPEDLSKLYFAAVLLPRKEAFMHSLSADANNIVKHDSALPSPAAKVDTYVLVNLSNGEIFVADKPRLVAAQERQILIDGLLSQAETKAGSKELIETIERCVEEIAEEAGLQTAELVGRAKSSVAAQSDRSEYVNTEALAKHVFEDSEALQKRFEDAVEELDVPDEVPIKRALGKRLAKSHKIKTDTGIEISFPTEYASDANYIEFSTDDEGMVSIVIKNVAKIENK